jgi:hypothetical protein
LIIIEIISGREDGTIIALEIGKKGLEIFNKNKKTEIFHEMNN